MEGTLEKKGLTGIYRPWAVRHFIYDVGARKLAYSKNGIEKGFVILDENSQAEIVVPSECGKSFGFRVYCRRNGKHEQQSLTLVAANELLRRAWMEVINSSCRKGLSRRRSENNALSGKSSVPDVVLKPIQPSPSLPIGAPQAKTEISNTPHAAKRVENAQSEGVGKIVGVPQSRKEEALARASMARMSLLPANMADIERQTMTRKSMARPTGHYVPSTRPIQALPSLSDAALPNRIRESTTGKGNNITLRAKQRIPMSVYLHNRPIGPSGSHWVDSDDDDDDEMRTSRLLSTNSSRSSSTAMAGAPTRPNEPLSSSPRPSTLHPSSTASTPASTPNPDSAPAPAPAPAPTPTPVVLPSPFPVPVPVPVPSMPPTLSPNEELALGARLHIKRYLGLLQDSESAALDLRWQNKVDKKGITIDTSPVAGSTWQSIRARRFIKASAVKVFAFLSDTSHIRDFDDMYDTFQLLERVDEVSQIRRMLYKPVWPTQGRDFVVVSTSERLDDGTLLLATRSVPDGTRCPPVKTHVRGAVNSGGYLIQPAESLQRAGDPDSGKCPPGGCRLTLIAHTELGGKLPPSLINMLSTQAPFNMLTAIAKHVE